MRRDANISALLSSRSEVCVQRDICGLGLCWPLACTGFKRNKDQERTVELIFFVEIHNRTLPDVKYIFHGISYEFYYTVFSIFQCHSNVSVDLNANFINKKSLMSICVIFKFTGLHFFRLHWLYGLPTVLCHLGAAQQPQPYPPVPGWNANNMVERLFD